MSEKAKSVATHDRTATRLLEDGAVFRVLAAACGYPDADSRQRVARELADVRTAQATRLRTGAWSRLFRAFEEGWTHADGAELESEHVRLFLGAGRCVLRETAYGDARRIAGRSFELADIAGFYRAFGWKLAPSRPQLPDHLSTELEFTSLLLVKEAYAIVADLDEELAVTRKAVGDFIAAHLGRWIPALAAELVGNRASPVYVALIDLVRSAIDRQCKRLGIAPEPAPGRLPGDFMQDETLECPREAEPASDESSEVRRG